MFCKYQFFQKVSLQKKVKKKTFLISLVKYGYRGSIFQTSYELLTINTWAGDPYSYSEDAINSKSCQL